MTKSWWPNEIFTKTPKSKHISAIRIIAGDSRPGKISANAIRQILQNYVKPRRF